MRHVYVKFNEIPTDEQHNLESWAGRTMGNALIKLLSSVIPKANPDFENTIRDVKQWMLEVDEEDGTPSREIGLDVDGNVLMIMPWQNNHGFWTDSNVLVDELAKSYEMQFAEQGRIRQAMGRF